MHVAILGPGRLGRSLAILLEQAGVGVSLLGRDTPIPPAADGVLLTVPDDAIAEASRGLPPGLIALHTSGATAFEVLRPHRPAGSFHPLMTFPGPHALPDLAGVPAALAGDPKAVSLGDDIAKRLGMRPIVVPGDRRLYHAAAVMAGNFATVLLAEASAILTAAGVPADDAPGILAPLALRSLANAGDDPMASLTGPVARGDHAVIAAHRQALAEFGLLDQLGIYEALTRRAEALIRAKEPVGETLGSNKSPGK
ncbi:MAG: DUF2520 domain-containing protein [Proteobacteria bacterium]|nr:DUF2520 domain-containing protein [Pseudomonadota bacterium]